MPLRCVLSRIIASVRGVHRLTTDQQIVCWGRHFKRAPSEAAQLWGKVRTGTLTWSELGAGTVQTGYIALWGITPYTLVSVTLANPTLRLSDKEGGHH